MNLLLYLTLKKNFYFLMSTSKQDVNLYLHDSPMNYFLPVHPFYRILYRLSSALNLKRGKRLVESSLAWLECNVHYNALIPLQRIILGYIWPMNFFFVFRISFHYKTYEKKSNIIKFYYKFMLFKTI